MFVQRLNHIEPVHPVPSHNRQQHASLTSLNDIVKKQTSF